MLTFSSEKWSDDVCMMNFFKTSLIPILYLISVARFTEYVYRYRNFRLGNVELHYHLFPLLISGSAAVFESAIVIFLSSHSGKKHYTPKRHSTECFPKRNLSQSQL